MGIESFAEKGWVVADLIDKTPLLQARKALEDHLATLLNKRVALEEYHTIAPDDAFHTQTQIAMTAFFRKEKLAKKVIESQVSYFQKLVGLDLYVQTNPYLRMARPFKKQDNVGYHRDTFYGGSPYELSVILPFVECDALMTLKVMTGSHILPETLFPVTQEISQDVTKGSDKHKLGFLYSPKLMDPKVEENMTAVPLKLGQILIFSLSIVHGCVENKGSKTRWSSDVRVLNQLAPVSLKDRPDYYEPLSLSPVTQSARRYYEENALSHHS